MSRRSRFLKPLAKLVCKIQQQITFKLGILADFIRRSLQPCWRTFANWPQSKVENTVEMPVGVSHVQIWPGLISFSDLLLDIFESQQTCFSVRSQRIPKTGAKINYKHAESLRQKKKKKKKNGHYFKSLLQSWKSLETLLGWDPQTTLDVCIQNYFRVATLCRVGEERTASLDFEKRVHCFMRATRNYGKLWILHYRPKDVCPGL